MRKKTNVILIALLGILSTNCYTGYGQTSPNPVWAVKVGDNRNFTFIKMYNINSETPTQKNIF